MPLVSRTHPHHRVHPYGCQNGPVPPVVVPRPLNATEIEFHPEDSDTSCRGGWHIRFSYARLPHRKPDRAPCDLQLARPRMCRPRSRLFEIGTRLNNQRFFANPPRHASGSAPRYLARLSINTRTPNPGTHGAPFRPASKGVAMGQRACRAQRRPNHRGQRVASKSSYPELGRP